MCDESGEPVSTEVFHGNTQDMATFEQQVKKVKERFGCKRVTFVGDRGMIKRTQIEKLPEGFHYITAITKSEIESLIKKGIIQLELFDEDLCEIEDSGIRYILRRNSSRAEEMSHTRTSKLRTIEELVKKKNKYLQEHLKARVDVGIKEVTKKIEKLKLNKWLNVKTEGRIISLETDGVMLKKESLLDGCYAIKTDLSKEIVNKEVVHGRYKDLSLVDQAFREYKGDSLEIRPVFVRKKKSTRGHVVIVMLGYMIIRKLSQAWSCLNLTVEEGIKQLNTLSITEVRTKEGNSWLKIPIPRKMSEKLLNALDIKMPTVLPHCHVRVVTKKKLIKHHKTL